MVILFMNALWIQVVTVVFGFTVLGIIRCLAVWWWRTTSICICTHYGQRDRRVHRLTHITSHYGRVGQQTLTHTNSHTNERPHICNNIAQTFGTHKLSDVCSAIWSRPLWLCLCESESLAQTEIQVRTVRTTRHPQIPANVCVSFCWLLFQTVTRWTDERTSVALACVCVCAVYRCIRYRHSFAWSIIQIHFCRCFSWYWKSGAIHIVFIGLSQIH